MNDKAEILIEKLVYGGNGLGHLKTGHAVFVAGVLPGERVVIALKKKRKDFSVTALDISQAALDIARHAGDPLRTRANPPSMPT